VRDDEPIVREVTAAVYVIPTDTPEADGTLTWDKTTMVLASARAGTARGIGWTYAATQRNPSAHGTNGPPQAGVRDPDPSSASAARGPTDRCDSLTALAGGLACIDLEDEVSYGREGEVWAVAEDDVASTGKLHQAGGLRR